MEPDEQWVVATCKKPVSVPVPTVFKASGFYYFGCPYCAVTLEVKEDQLNCKIFRCGVLRATGEQVPPHAPKAECDRLVAGNLILGCAGPFKFDGTSVRKCDYI